MPIEPQATVASIATAHPLSTRVFQRHGIDFCCGGHVPLAEAAAERGLDPQAVVSQIELALTSGADLGIRWDEQPVEVLIGHLVDTYHVQLREDLPRLESLARKVHRVHGDKDPEVFAELLSRFLGLKADLDQHLVKEEEVLFPRILAGGGVEGTVAELVEEHEGAGRVLARLRELTGDYAVPAEACNTWRALWAGLADLERSLHEHIHLENNILFPAAGS